VFLGVCAPWYVRSSSGLALRHIKKSVLSHPLRSSRAVLLSQQIAVVVGLSPPERKDRMGFYSDFSLDHVTLSGHIYFYNPPHLPPPPHPALLGRQSSEP